MRLELILRKKIYKLIYGQVKKPHEPQLELQKSQKWN